MKVLLVGRHTPSDMPKIEVVRTQNILFSALAEECEVQFQDLFDNLEPEIEGVLFQTLPNQAWVALTYLLMKEKDSLTKVLNFFTKKKNLPKIGFVVSTPGPRQAGIQKEFSGSESEMNVVKDFVKFANGNAKVEVANGKIVVTVDPISKFNFSHIEWVN